MKKRMIVLAFLVAVLLSSCTVNMCVRPFGYNPLGLRGYSCRVVYTDGTPKPIYNIYR